MAPIRMAIGTPARHVLPFPAFELGVVNLKLTNLRISIANLRYVEFAVRLARQLCS
jgi:hypothetical protein